MSSKVKELRKDLLKEVKKDPLLGKGRGWKPNGAKKKVSPYYKVANDLAEFYNTKCNRLMGELLTTLEATVDEDRQLEALKTRVKDIQNLAWEEMNQEIWGNIIWFEEGQHSPTDLESLTNKTVQGCLTNYGAALSNLIKAVFFDPQRAAALNKEISRLVHTTRVSIHRALGQIIASAFPETTEKAEEDEAEEKKG